ncbi:MAG: 4Fe-4S dicluster domain-containing protein [Clostridia bacterium]|nr:4Fe-4S dicluster domain-containing protein [Clostridia bacterium]
MKLEQLAQIMKTHGIIGAGGAGFPSGSKLNSDADTIILNCAECEPLFKLHRQLLATYTHEIMTALMYVKEAVGAKKVIIALKPSYKEAIDRVNYYLPSFEGFSIALLPKVYPVGDEIVLIYETTGKVIKPGKLPISEGVIVYNVETMLNTYYAVEEDINVTEKYITITGEIQNPGTFKVPVGITIKEAVALTGGEKSDDCMYLGGGLMTGDIVYPNDPVTKKLNAVLVLPKNSSIIQKRLSNTNINIQKAMSICCQCRSCTDLCSRHLLGYPIEPHLFMRAISKGMTSDTEAILNANYCSQCGLCELFSCPQDLSPRSLIAKMKAELRKNGVPAPQNPKFTGISPDREYKQVQMNRLRSRLGVTGYYVPATLDEKEVKFKEVKIMLNQHIGPPAVPVVKKGDTVTKGQLIATTEGKLGSDAHSSCDGKVLEVTDLYVIIKRRTGNK